MSFSIHGLAVSRGIAISRITMVRGVDARSVARTLTGSTCCCCTRSGAW
jgi:hypothetical protein